MTVKYFDDFLKDLDEIEKLIQKLFNKTIEKTKLSNIELIVKQAEWHLRGCIYHCRNIIKYYKKIQILLHLLLFHLLSHNPNLFALKI